MAANPNQKTVSDAVYEKLKRSILRNELPGGTRLREGALAEEYGVSRTPIRSALERLRENGLVTRGEDDKLFVFQASETDIYNLFAIRRELAVYSMIQAADKIGDGDIAKLSKLAAKADAAIISGSLAEQSAADMAFHGFLIACSKNPLFAKLLEQIQDKLTLSINSIFAGYDFRNKDESDLPSSHRLLVNNLREYMKTGAARPLELIIEHHFSFHPWLDRVSAGERKRVQPLKTKMTDFLMMQYRSVGSADSEKTLFREIQENNPFYPINKAVYDLLLHDIIVGRILPEQDISISEIAAQLDISRNPVRDAIDRLIKEGLMERGERTGLFVHKYTGEEIENIYYARLALETAATALAARYAGTQDLIAVREAHQQFLESVRTEDIDMCIASDSAFHTAIVNGSRNPFIVEAYQSLYPHIRAWVWQATRVERKNISIWKNIAKDHERILDYLNRHNPDGAKLSMKQHIISIVSENG